MVHAMLRRILAGLAVGAVVITVKSEVLKQGHLVVSLSRTRQQPGSKDPRPGVA